MRSVFDVRNEIAFIPTSPLWKQEPCMRRCLNSCSHLSIPLQTASQILRRLHLKNKRCFISEFFSPRWHQYSLPRIRFLSFVTRFFRYIRCSKIELNLHTSIFFFFFRASDSPYHLTLPPQHSRGFSHFQFRDPFSPLSWGLKQPGSVTSSHL